MAGLTSTKGVQKRAEQTATKYSLVLVSTNKNNIVNMDLCPKPKNCLKREGHNTTNSAPLQSVALAVPPTVAEEKASGSKLRC